MSAYPANPLSVLFAIETVRYARLATVSIIFFDHLTMLDQEIEYIWKGHWTIINVVYLANRYYALSAAVISIYGDWDFPSQICDQILTITDSILQLKLDHIGVAFFQWEGWTGLIFSVFGQVILQFRLYALYALDNKRKAVVVPMVALFVICSSLCGWLMWRNISRAGVAAILIPGSTFCVNIEPSSTSTLYAFWIPVIIFESLLCILALLPGVRAYFEGDIYFTQSGQLIRILLRDSIIYFLVIVVTAIACLIGAIVAEGNYLDAPVGFSVAMTSTIGSRLILNIRDATNRRRKFMGSSLPVSAEMLIGST